MCNKYNPKIRRNGIKEKWLIIFLNANNKLHKVLVYF